MDSCKRGVFNNFILHDGICKECPIGTYGENCSALCPFGYHGRQCLLECNCSVGEFCHPSQGCGVLMTNGIFYTIERKDVEAEESCNKDVVFSVSLCVGIFLLLILVYITCCHKGRFNIRDALRRKLENIASDVYVGFEQRRQEQDAVESGENHYTYQRNTYVEIDSPDRKSTNDYSDLFLEPVSVQPSPSNLICTISTEINSPEAQSDDKIEDKKTKREENEENEDPPVVSSVSSNSKTDDSEDHISETGDDQGIIEESETVVNDIDLSASETDNDILSRSEDSK